MSGAGLCFIGPFGVEITEKISNASLPHIIESNFLAFISEVLVAIPTYIFQTILSGSYATPRRRFIPFLSIFVDKIQFS